MEKLEGRMNINDLFSGNRYFEIPDYQRSYTWEEKQIKDFLEDFSHAENYQKYYYGTILLKQKENGGKAYEIVDGQQRLTTLIIFMKCLIKKMLEHGNKKEAEKLTKKYIKNKSVNILKLQKQDNLFFTSYVLSDNNNLEYCTPAQRNLLVAKKYFEDSLNNCDDKELSDYKTRIQAANCLVYTIQDQNEAAMIFETTNDRGKLLTNLEKTKSFLMYKVSTTFKNSSLLDTIPETFNKIYHTYEVMCKHKKFKLNEDSIQQYMFIAFEDWKTKSEGSRTVKTYQHYLDELKTKINNLVNEVNRSKGENKELNKQKLENYINTYIENLTNSFIAVKNMFDSKYEAFYKLLSLDRMASIYPLLIKSYLLDTTKDKSNFTSLCDVCEIFCFRGLTIFEHPANMYQDKLFALARDFKNDFNTLFEEIKKLILQLGDDDKFLNKLKDKEFFLTYGSQDRNYFFWGYENYLRSTNGYPPLSFDDLWETNRKKKLTIEHIVAQADKKDKTRIIADEKFINISGVADFDKEYLHSIGNLTIDPQSANSAKGNQEVKTKNSNFFRSAPLMSQNELDNFMENDEWTIKSIDNRRDKIIEFAKTKWCF